MDLSDNQELVWLSRLVADVRQAVPGARPLLVGAMARDLLLHYGAGVRIARATADTDLAFAVSDWQEFMVLRQGLVDSGNFRPGQAEHRLLHRESKPVDLILFGGVQDCTGSINWPNNGNTMGVLGFQEAASTAVDIRLPEGERVATVSLAMLALLKLLAWTERRLQSPRKDASDFFLVIGNFLNSERLAALAADHVEMFEQDGFDYETGGAWFAGRSARDEVLSCSGHASLLIDKIDGLILVAWVGQRFVADSDLALQRASVLWSSFVEGWQSTSKINMSAN